MGIIGLFIFAVGSSVTAMFLYDKFKGPQARAIESNLGGGGPANFGAKPVNELNADIPTPDMQPSWWTRDGMYIYENATPNQAGIPANNFGEPLRRRVY